MGSRERQISDSFIPVRPERGAAKSKGARGATRTIGCPSLADAYSKIKGVA